MPVRSYRVLLPLVAAVMLAVTALACGQLGLPATEGQVATQAPAAGAVQPAVTPTEMPTADMAIIPTVTEAPNLPTVAVTPRPTSAPATPKPTLLAAAALTATTVAPTIDSHHVVITDADIASSITGGGLTEAGVQADNLAVKFSGGRTRISADNIVYGPINLQNLVVLGRLGAKDGVLQMDVESVAPQGFISGMIPNVINQALKQYTSQWYIEDVQTGEGQLELRVR